MPRTHQGWASTTRVLWYLLTVCLIVAALLTAVVLAGIGDTMSHGNRAELFGLLVQGLFTVVAAILMYIAWRITASAALGWLSAALLFVGLQDLPFLVASFADPAGNALEVGEGLDVAAGAFAMWMLVQGRRGVARVSPILLGLGGTATSIAARATALRGDLLPSGRVGGSAALEPLLVLTICLVALVAVLRTPTYSGRTRLVLGIATLGAGVRAVVETGGNPSTLWSSSTVSGVLALAMGLLLLDMAVRMLLDALADHQAQVEHLARRALAAEDDARRGADLLHEVRAGVGGLATASHLLASRSELTEVHRARLRQAVRDQLSRISRTLQAEPTTVQDFDLEAVLEPVIDLHRASGAEIVWTPAPVPERVRHVPDTVAQVLGTLLDNADRHAPGVPVRVSCHVLGGVTRIEVSQSGPEVDPSVRRRLFERGARSTSSPGSGIGLYVARQMMRAHGGDLRLVSSTPERTTFTIELSRAEA